LRRPPNPLAAAARPAAAGPTPAERAQVHLDRAGRHEAAGRLAEAIADLEPATRLMPADAVAHCNLGLTCLKANRLPPAVASLREAVRLKPYFGRPLQPRHRAAPAGPRSRGNRGIARRNCTEGAGRRRLVAPRRLAAGAR